MTSSSVVPEKPTAPTEAAVDVVGRHRRLLGRTLLVSFLTLLSRIVGFAREAVAASIFGDHSAVNDAFVTAWRVPNLFRSLLGEGAISTSFQTALTQADARHGEEAGRALFVAIVRIVWWITFALCCVVMLGLYFMPDTMPITGFAWLGADPGPVRELTMRMMPFVILVCIAAVCSGALYVRGHYLSPNLGPVLMNIWWLAALFIVTNRFGWARPDGFSDGQEQARQMNMARWLAAFVLVGGSIHLVVLVPALARRGLFFGGRRSVAGSGTSANRAQVWNVLKASLPLAVGAAVYQVNLMVDGLMAESLLENGGPSLLYWATRVQQFPMSLVSIAATSAVYPALAALGHQRSLREMRALHDRTHLAIAFVAIPASFGMFALAEPIMAACFQRGAFSAIGVERAAAGLRFLSLAILPAGAAGLVARTYYALGDFKTPVRISVCMLLANIALNGAFVWLGMDLDGLTCATAICAWGNLLLLLPGLQKRLQLPGAEHGFAGRLARIAAAGALSAAVALATYHLTLRSMSVPRALLCAIAASLASYAACAHLMRLPEWKHTIERLTRSGSSRRS